MHLAVEKMSVQVHFESGSYQVQESCTLLSVTLVVIGEVKKSFTVDITSTSKDYSTLSAKSMCCKMHIVELV